MGRHRRSARKCYVRVRTALDALVCWQCAPGSADSVIDTAVAPDHKWSFFEAPDIMTAHLSSMADHHCCTCLVALAVVWQGLGASLQGTCCC